METKAILTVKIRHPNPQINLYLPSDIWKFLNELLNSNKLTVVLRLAYEYDGELKLNEEESQ